MNVRPTPKSPSDRGTQRCFMERKNNERGGAFLYSDELFGDTVFQWGIKKQKNTQQESTGF